MPTAQVAPDIEIWYETFGSDDDPALVLIGGLGNQLLVWHIELCWSLVDRGFFVVTFDNRDAGLSSHPPDGVAYTLSDMADDVVGLLDVLGVDRAHVVGTSLGGMIAQTVAIDHPDRVATLTSISSHTGNPDYGSPTDEAVDALLAPEPVEREAAIERGVATRRVWASPIWFDEDAVRSYFVAAVDRAPPADTERQFLAAASGGSREDALARLAVPTLVIHGNVDPLVALSGGQRTAGIVPGAELLVIDGMGHDLPVQVWPQLIERITAMASRSAID